MFERINLGEFWNDARYVFVQEDLNNAGIAAISGAGRARTDDDGIMSSGL